MREPAALPVSRGRCLRTLAGHPASVGAATSIVLGAYALGAPLAIIPLLLAWMVAVWRGAGSPRLRRAVARTERKRQLSDLRERREQRLVEVRAPREGLQEATALVDEISRLAPEQAALLELEELLERYADLAVDQARCRALALVHDRNALCARRDMLARQGGDSIRLEVLARRIACAERCHEDLTVIDEALADLRELLQLAAAQAAHGQCEVGDTGTDEAIAARLEWMGDERE